MAPVQKLRRWLPPVLWDSARWLRHHVLRPRQPEWEFVPGSNMTNRQFRGWDVDSVLDVQQRKWPAFVAALKAPAPLGVAHEANTIVNDLLPAHNIIMSYAYVLMLAACGESAVSVLDWGGGLGHYYEISRALLPPNFSLDYSIKDVATLCRGGRERIPAVTFHETDDAAFSRSYDLVLASTSLQYASEWPTTLGKLARSARRYVYVTNIPVVERAKTFLVVQRPYTYGYNTEYPGWFFNRTELLECAVESRLSLVREFLVGARPPVYGAPEQGEYRGFLFRVAGTATVSGGADEDH